ncbi:Histidinol-phosphate aminotransferase [Rhodanobacter lindaniclasticus]
MKRRAARRWRAQAQSRASELRRGIKQIIAAVARTRQRGAARCATAAWRCDRLARGARRWPPFAAAETALARCVKAADDAGAIYQRLLAAGIVVRDVRRYPNLADALRITIGTPAENDRVLAVLAGRGVAEGSA